jgi:hypothetical protein
MTARVTITSTEYNNLKRQAAAWRLAIGASGPTVIFNAVRDNDGTGIAAGVLARKLRTLIAAE